MSESDSQNRSEDEGYAFEALSLLESPKEIDVGGAEDLEELDRSPHPSREEPEVSSLLRLVVSGSRSPKHHDYPEVSNVQGVGVVHETTSRTIGSLCPCRAGKEPKFPVEI